MWTPANSNGLESLKIKWELVPYTRGRGLDLGCGPRKPFPHFIGIDSNIDSELFGSEASARNMTGDCTNLSLFGDETMDFVFSSHLLEHIVDYKAALTEWWRVVKPGGYLCLYLPHKDFYPNVGTEGANPDHKHDFLPTDIVDAMLDIAPNFDLVRNENRNEGDEYSFFQVWQKLPGKWKADRKKQDRRTSYKNPRPEKTCAIVRYGAYGDVLQTASVLPGLKEQGYHVTWYGTPRGHEVIKHDPRVDAFVLQDDNQVPANEIGQLVSFLETKYDKVVNFCEAVEGSLLPSPGHAPFYWTKLARHALCNHNYIEMQHVMADLAYNGNPEVKFYATDAEKEWARKTRAACPGPVIMFALSGSSVHKVWPYVDTIVARIRLAVPKATVVLVGSPNEMALAYAWRNDPRVWCKPGVWDIRHSLAFAQVADIVIGPETGVLNAVSMERHPWKVLFLSHSSNENLSRDWKSTIAFAAEHVACYPCHQLHTSGFDYCTRHESGGAACAVAITPDHVWKAVKQLLGTMVAGPISDEFDSVEPEIANDTPAEQGAQPPRLVSDLRGEIVAADAAK
jgi:ADP-heptose:LPS heptosyltransferase/predicted SAM-dependent methyltransferase